MTDAILLRQRVAPGSADAVRELVADESARRAESGTDGLPETDGLLRTEGVHTASLFLDRTDEASPGLVWYVEVEDAGRAPWTDPVTTLVRDAPLFDAGLGELLEAPDSTRVFSDASAGGDVLVHASLPGRPNSVGKRIGAEEVPTNRSSGDATDGTPDVALFRLRVEPGAGEWFARALAGLTKRLDDDGRIERTFDEWSEPVLEAERMWTETIFLERTDGEFYLCWYMEAEDMDGVYEAYFETSNRLARISEYVIGWILADPRRALSNPVESSNFELLAHGASPDRS